MKLQAAVISLQRVIFAVAMVDMGPVNAPGEADMTTERVSRSYGLSEEQAYGFED